MLLLAFLSGCGTYTQGQGGQSQPTPTPSRQAQNCGTVDTALNGQPLDKTRAKASGNCFLQAYQNCQTASLLLVEHSLDTKAEHMFTSKSTNGKCSITDTVKHFLLPNHLTSTITYSCGGLSMQADGLHFMACGGAGNIDLPI